MTINICSICGRSNKRTKYYDTQEEILCDSCLLMCKKHPIIYIPPKGEIHYSEDGSIKEYRDIVVYAFWIRADFEEIIDAYIDTSALSAKGYKDFVGTVIKDVCEHSLWPDVGTIRKSAVAIFSDNDFEKKGRSKICN